MIRESESKDFFKLHKGQEKGENIEHSYVLYEYEDCGMGLQKIGWYGVPTEKVV